MGASNLSVNFSSLLFSSYFAHTLLNYMDGRLVKMSLRCLCKVHSGIY